MFNILGSRILLRTWRAVNFLPPKIHIQKYTETPTITSLRKLKWFLFASDWLSVGCSFYFILFFDIIFLLPKPILLTDIWATFWWCLDSFWILDIKKSRLNLKQHLTQSKGPSRIFRTLELNKETRWKSIRKFWISLGKVKSFHSKKKEHIFHPASLYLKLMWKVMLKYCFNWNYHL